MKPFLLDIQERQVLVAGLRHCLALSNILDEHAAGIAHRQTIRDLMRRLAPTDEETAEAATPIEPRRRRKPSKLTERFEL